MSIPEPDPDWDPIALRWYESLPLSGQSTFYEPADWMTAWTVAESMSREFKPQPLIVGSGEHAKVEMHKLPPKAATLTAWAKLMSGLLVLEGDRRRVGLELQREPEEAKPDVSELAEYRARLKSG